VRVLQVGEAGLASRLLHALPHALMAHAEQSADEGRAFDLRGIGG